MSFNVQALKLEGIINRKEIEGKYKERKSFRELVLV